MFLKKIGGDAKEKERVIGTVAAAVTNAKERVFSRRSKHFAFDRPSSTRGTP
jgi:hypothetical protein